MIDNIEFENGLYGTKAIIRSSWQESFSKLLLDKEVKDLEFNDGKGWRGENVDFLRILPGLKSLTIIDFSIKSIEAIHYLSELEKLELSTYCKTPINFNSFPKLIECGFEWIKGSESLFDSTSIQKLYINSYDKKRIDVFSSLYKLEELSILNSPIENLKGLTGLKNLKTLRLGNLKKLTSLQGLENLNELERLEIQRCKGIFTLKEIFELKKLKWLLLSDLGDIESIKGIEDLKELNNFLFYESTNVTDGDISPVLKLKNLVKVSFQNRKHYTHRREDLGSLYP